MSATPWDYIAKLVCIGDSGCGKSSLTIRLCEGRFVTHHDVTIGVEFGSRIVPVGPPKNKGGRVDDVNYLSSSSRLLPATGVAAAPAAAAPGSNDPTPGAEGSCGRPAAGPQKHMKLSLWDTAGQETYKSVTRSYFRGASGALLVFDLSRKATFEHATDCTQPPSTPARAFMPSPGPGTEHMVQGGLAEACADHQDFSRAQ